MKKVTLSTIANILSSVEFENKASIMEELNVELNRGAEEKAAKNAEYESAWEVVAPILSDGTYTVADIFNECEKSLPKGFSKGRLQYGLTHQWADKVVKIEGKPCTYSMKA